MAAGTLLGSLALVVSCAQQQPAPAPPPPAPRFVHGVPADTFPIGVWLQSPENAKRYAELGVDLYVGLYGGPTEAQLRALDAAKMRVICAQNEVALKWPAGTIVGWLHGDEPDNAQGRRLQGYAPPIPPWQIVADYERLHRADPTRPILLNLGQGAAWDGWHGRGERTGHPEDYPDYCKGCDLVSFDIYPVTHRHRDVAGKLEFVGHGVRRLVGWTRGTKPVWAVIETSHVDNAKVRPTPEQVRAEVWIAITSGASGIVWFAHAFAPTFVEAGLLAHPEIAAAARDIAAEVHAAAPVLLAPRADEAVVATGTGELAVRVHEHDGALHVFVASLQGSPQTVTVAPRDAARGRAELVGRAPAGTAAAEHRDGALHAPLEAYGHRRFRIAR
jgi:hypothetical protein